MATSEHRKAYIKKWLQDNREAHLKQQKQWRADHAEQRQGYERKRREGLKRRLLAHYGETCSCCGESNPAFLCIDHVDGGGEAHRREVGSGTKFFWWLEKNNCPPGFRTLCQNCNFGVWAYGTCPHQGAASKTGGPRYEYMKQLRSSVRRAVLLHYNPDMKCACCGEDRFEFLTLDHVDGGGKQHQKTAGRGSQFYKWIVANGFPTGFQVLCHNCNSGKGTSEVCPHQSTTTSWTEASIAADCSAHGTPANTPVV